MKALIRTLSVLVQTQLQNAFKHKERKTKREKKRAEKVSKKKESNQELQQCQLAEKEQRAKDASIDVANQKLFA